MALDWRDSTTYQAILRDGRERGLITGRIVGAKRILVRLGFKRFGAPGAGILVAVEAIRDLARIDALADRIIDRDVHDWNEWLLTS